MGNLAVDWLCAVDAGKLAIELVIAEATCCGRSVGDTSVELGLLLSLVIVSGPGETEFVLFKSVRSAVAFSVASSKLLTVGLPSDGVNEILLKVGLLSEGVNVNPCLGGLLPDLVDNELS